MMPKSQPSRRRGWEPVFRKTSCSIKKLEREDDSKRSHPALTGRHLPVFLQHRVALRGQFLMVGHQAVAHVALLDLDPLAEPPDIRPARRLLLRRSTELGR